MTIPAFQRTIWIWYRTNRRDLPWRNTRDPYKILVSEVMLQQTQISRVLPKYKEFLEAFPTLEALAKAPDRKVLKTWQGLGYWRRALNLKKAAKMIAAKNSRPCIYSRAPKDAWKGFQTPEELKRLPGVGPYTARAVACFAFGECEPFLDTNIRRVYLHFFFPKRQKVSDKEILPIAKKALNSLRYDNSHDRRNYHTNPREWHYALFDYGATVLKDKSINKRSRHYAKQSRFEGSFRSFRTKIMRSLLDQPGQSSTVKKIQKLLQEEGSPYPAEKVLSSLLKDGLLKKKGRSYSL